MTPWEPLLTDPIDAGLLTLSEAQQRVLRAASQLEAERTVVGHSREGRPIELIRIGTGEHRSFWYGGPHSNEPVGVATVVELVERLATHPETVRGDIGFDLILCVDPDSYVRNENWFAGTVDMAAYYRDFYRQPLSEMPDWDFPIDYLSTSGSLKRNSTLPENKALTTALEISRPYLVYALHNAEVGGLHYIVKGADQDLIDRLSALSERFGLPIEEACVDDPSIQPLARGVFPMPSLAGTFEALLNLGHENPSSLLPFGASAAEWCQRYGAVSVVPEIPFWSVATDLTADDPTVADLARRTAHQLSAFGAWLADTVEVNSVYLPKDNPWVRSVLDSVGMFRRIPAALVAWADTGSAVEAMGPDAVARYSVMLGLCLPQRTRGMLVTALESGGAPAEIVGLASEEFESGLAALNSIPFTAHSVSTLVEVQLTTGLESTAWANCARGPRRPGGIATAANAARSAVEYGVGVGHDDM
ncbi:M14 family zinc carboxypeptidase [Nocardia sp. FBN12]|uniref:M14 family zinc carboxypeptidase n=1 Tax=Nocardia sp. FBN12 TaxID=3419766 RepID=UPI003D03453E